MTSIRVYNSLIQKKEEFRPLKKGKVGMYVCGITAYDACHLGHARAAVAFDVVYRYLKQSGFDVTYVRNFTDIDDKIIRRSQETNTPWRELTERYIAEYAQDMRLLNVAAPTQEPRATQFIPQMVKAIEGLIKNGVAYESNGSVYYSVRAFRDYGKLSHKKIEELESGARIEIDETKKDPLDFALWKKAKHGEPTWKSPWGEGRPGWHIECSVMSTALLGQPFDIHGGGRDLIFPHHENEIAQAEGLSAKPFCKHFLHNGFININTEKMSKSLKNFLTIKEVIDKHDAEVVRYFLISAHYGSPIDYTEKNMAEAKLALDRFYLLAERLEKISLAGLEKARKPPKKPAKFSAAEKKLAASLKELPKKFEAAMDDDFNTVKVLGALFETIRVFNKTLDSNTDPAGPFAKWARAEWEKTLKSIREVLGVFVSAPADYFARFKAAKTKAVQVDAAWVEAKIEERSRARAARDFKKGDALREELVKLGIELKDRPDGTTEWKAK